MALKVKTGPIVSTVGNMQTGGDQQSDKYVPGTLTLDGSGNGNFQVGMPVCALQGIRVIVVSGSSFPFTLANMGRTILAATASASTWYATAELITNADGTTTNKFYSDGATIVGSITFTVAAGTAGGQLQVEFVYEV